MENIDPTSLRRLKKLKAMADGGTEHESAVAEKKMRALMEKWGVTDSQVRMADVFEMRLKGKTYSCPRWIKRLANRVAITNYCRSLIETGGGEYHQLIFYGKEQNVRATAAMSSYLKTEIKRRGQAYSRSLPASKSKTRDVESYRFGVIEAVNKRLRKHYWGEVAAGTLVARLDLDPELNEFRDSEYGEIKKAGSRHWSERDSRIAARGFVDGEDINLSRQLRSDKIGVNMLEHKGAE